MAQSLTDAEIRDAKNRARLAFPYPQETDLDYVAKKDKIREVPYKSDEGQAMLNYVNKETGEVEGFAGAYDHSTGNTRIINELPPEARKAILSHELAHSAENQLGIKEHNRILDGKLKELPEAGEFMSPSTKFERYPGETGSPQHEAAVRRWSIRAAARNGGQMLDEDIKKLENKAVGEPGTIRRALREFLFDYTPVRPSNSFDYDRMLEANKANP